MGSIVHARRKTPDGPFVYRLWNTTCDRYETDEMDGDQLALQLKYMAAYQWAVQYERDLVDIPKRIERAQHNGTSSRIPGDTTALDAPWDTEKCDECGRFHHAFAPAVVAVDPRCRSCGELREDKAHEPPCEDG